MLQSRLLLPLCRLLLALAVTAVSAGAPLYGPGEVRITTAYRGPYLAQFGEIQYCSAAGGSLVPMVTEAVYMQVKGVMGSAYSQGSFSYMGASTTLSPSGCTTSAPSLNCIWYWDQGRYSGAANAVAFYKGNRDASVLPTAGMTTTSVSNHWRSSGDGGRCPCEKMERQGGVLHDAYEGPVWTDTGKVGYSYDPSETQITYSLCAIEDTTTSTTTTAPSGVANRPLAAHLAAAVAIVLMAVVA